MEKHHYRPCIDDLDSGIGRSIRSVGNKQDV